MKETKNEALELAYELSVAAVDGTLNAAMGHDAAAMLRSQAIEIDRLKLMLRMHENISSVTAGKDVVTMLKECDQLKTKNQKLVAVVTLFAETLPIGRDTVKTCYAVTNEMRDAEHEALKENT